MKWTKKEILLLSEVIDLQNPAVNYIYQSGYLAGLKEAHKIYSIDKPINDSMENEFQRAGADIKKASNVISFESEIL